MKNKLCPSAIAKKKYIRERNRLIKACCDTANAVVRLRDKVCQRCNRSTGKLDVAHVIEKQHLRTRFDLWNLIYLCFDCHRRKWHEQGDGTKWFSDKFPHRWDYLQGTIRAGVWKPTNEGLQQCLVVLQEKLADFERIEK
jgi:5-methylcytosine-specific restriction endonuclease McrA